MDDNLATAAESAVTFTVAVVLVGDVQSETEKEINSVYKAN